MDDMTRRSCREFSELLASSAPTPGGGGAAALTGALAAALGGMVVSLTAGKKQYETHEEELAKLGETCGDLRRRLLDLVQADAEAFAPLAKAYGMAKDDPARDDVLERTTLAACQPPMEIMTCCLGVIRAASRLAEIGSRLALSDAGCAASLASAAMESASLNVQINTRALRDRQEAGRLDRRTEELLREGTELARQVFDRVTAEWKGT